MKVKLTRAEIQKAAHASPGRSYYLMDSELPGFGVRVHHGRKSYIVRYRKRPYVLGPVQVLTLEQARQQGRELLARLWSGEEVKPRRSRAQAAAAPTLTDLFERFMREHAEPHLSPASVKAIDQIWRKHLLPKLGAKTAVAELGRDEVVAMHLDIGRVAPVAANRAIVHLGSALLMAESWGWRPHGSNPASRVKKFAEHPKERVLTEEELRRLGEAMREAGRLRLVTAPALALLRLMALTGARPGELMSLTWKQVDLERGIISLSRAKGDRAGRRKGRVIVLSAPAVSVVSEMRSLGGAYVFPGQRPNKPISSLGKIWERLCASAKIEDATPYTLRHTYVTRSKRAGAALEDTSDLVGHADIDITKRVYLHSQAEDLKPAAEAVGNYIASLLGE